MDDDDLKFDNENENGVCRFCDNSGMVLAVRNDHRYAFRCSCKHGDKYVHNFTIWNYFKFNKLGFKMMK